MAATAIGDDGDIAWLTPTSAAKLLACPASLSVSILPNGERPQPPSGTPDNAGALAHLAVQHWAESGGWRNDVNVPCLRDFFRQEASTYGIVVEALIGGRITESRLKAQEQALAHAIRSYAGGTGSVLTELSLYDDTNHLWGTIDLLVQSDQGATVIDLKSGGDASKVTVSEGIRKQLVHYALLVLAETGSAPKTLAVFSLTRGLRVLDFNADDMKSLRAEIDLARRAWIEGLRPAVPSSEHCRFCKRRLDCDAHWAEFNEWTDPDAAQGMLVLIETAANGSSSLTLTHDGKKVWVSDVPAAAVAGLKRGLLTRGVRLRRRQRDIHDEQQREIWYADEQSAFRGVQPASEQSKK